MNQELQIVSSQGNGSSVGLPLPQARVAIAIRAAVLGDVPFMDGLQRLHSKQVGFFPTKQFEGNILQGKVLVAWACRPCSSSSSHDMAETAMLREEPVGYCIASDRYFKHDDVGIIYQMNVVPGRQRGLIGASLLKAQFERSAYGCKLYCCWCAQDIAANKFWEAMGFVALAFRTGGRGTKSSGARTHIFWQKRIRSGDTTTPWWFPSETAGGAVRENRLVLPIPPGTHWSDAKPLVLPGETHAGETKQIEDKAGRRPAGRKIKPKVAIITKRIPLSGGLSFHSGESVQTAVKEEKPKRQKKAAVKNDPRLVAAARELRDRWLEKVNAGQYLPEGAGKYDVTRRLEGAESAPTPLFIEQAA